MTHITTRIQAVLQADSTLTGLLTGGIYTSLQLGQVGLDAENTVCTNAFTLVDGMYELQPCAVISAGQRVPSGRRVDNITQTQSTNQTLEIYFYDGAGFDTISTARERVRTLLHANTFANIGALRHSNRIDYLYARELQDAPMHRDDYLCISKLVGG